ncbi:HELP domain containing protein [Ectocarpus siliculosus]|uniref:HELP domain containing protein n=1 Tax=Ectocarpus siliculosus TaxID=2880 RepID=D7FMU4_ECTSI|nr:HELP domain containing protein [Ectocarpus siliculosus]|eukprot:CBJ30008.1 HELP domain containing protein [Ectocarpus siliculosus]
MEFGQNFGAAPCAKRPHHTTRIPPYRSHVEFSKDLLFFHVEDGRRMTAKSKTKDLAFETQTCPAGWTVQATWPQGRPDLEPVSTDRCTPALVEGQPQLGALLAVGYKTGQVEVFRYPCQNQGARSVSAGGHSTEAGRVRFNADGTALISIGSDSRVVLQHSVLPPLPPV